MPDSTLTAAERALLAELTQRGVRFMVVGMSAALLQGARGATEDIDLWFEDLSDGRIAAAVHAAGGIWISGSFGLGPPRIGGESLGDRFAVVTHMSGLARFADEYAHVTFLRVSDVDLPVLHVRRILASKQAANRPKDRGLLHSLQDALAIIEHPDDLLLPRPEE